MVERQKPNTPRRGGRHRRGRSDGAGPAGQSPDGWLYGTHAALAAIENPRRRCRRILATPETARDHGARIAAARPEQVPEQTTRPELDRMLPPGAVHQGLAILVDPLPEADLDEALAGAGRDALLVVLDQVTDPQNVGAVLRSAAVFGALAVVMTRDHAPPVAGALAKAASGALEVVPLVVVTNLARALDRLKAADVWCLGLTEDAEAPLAGAWPEGRAALVLGAEGKGLRRLTRERCDALHCLPTRGAIASLNVSNAAAVALYELARTRAG